MKIVFVFLGLMLFYANFAESGDGTLPFEVSIMNRPATMTSYPNLVVDVKNIQLPDQQESDPLQGITCTTGTPETILVAEGTIDYQGQTFQLRALCGRESQGEIFATGPKGTSLSLKGRFLRQPTRKFYLGDLQQENAPAEPFYLMINPGQSHEGLLFNPGGD